MERIVTGSSPIATRVPAVSSCSADAEIVSVPRVGVMGLAGGR